MPTWANRRSDGNIFWQLGGWQLLMVFGLVAIWAFGGGGCCLVDKGQGLRGDQSEPPLKKHWRIGVMGRHSEIQPPSTGLV